MGNMFESLRGNIAIEKGILEQLKNEPNESVRQGYVDLINMLNRAVPEIMKESSPLKEPSSPIGVVSVTYLDGSTAYVLASDKNIFDSVLVNIKKASKKKSKESKKKGEPQNFSTVTPSFIRSISNRFFRGLSESTISSFPGMQRNVKAANMPILPTTYLAVSYFFSMVAFFGIIVLYGFLLFLSVETYWIYFWVILVGPIVIFFGFIFYPKTEADAVKSNISYELPFSTIHMTAVAGSNIEPSNIFEIISRSKEYPNIGKEFQKVLVMIRVYGYDLVTALKNVSSRTSNAKLSELLSGIATNISSGGSLKNYLEKKSENYLVDYRLERKRYIDLAGTFMDIYISILIAAPMILMLMFIIMNVSGIGFQGFSITFLMLVSIIGIAIINVVFIIVINLKQPRV